MANVSYLVTDMEFCTQDDVTGKERDFKTEKAALKAATDLLAKSCGQDAEVWVWRLSHVLMKPTAKPIVEKVRESR